MRKILAILVTVLPLFCARPAAAEEKVILRCENPPTEEASIRYEIFERDGHRYHVRKVVDGKEVGSTALTRVEYAMGYGGAYAFFESRGRSGYFLMYSYPDRSEEGGPKAMTLIDINLFMAGTKNPLNTRGPQTQFKCEGP